jgi:hypothetical protein
MHVDIESRTFPLNGVEPIPEWRNKTRIAEYRRRADAGLGSTFLKRLVRGDYVTETLVWVARNDR